MSDHPRIHPEPARGAVSAVLWGCYLAASWTWIIGMLLPIFLLRDFGVWGWVAFAVPNVVGAAAMGFVLARPEASWALVGRHLAAMLRFSEVTVAYHVFAVGWVFSRLFGAWGPIATAAVALLVWMLTAKRRSTLITAAAVTAVSLALLGVWAAQQGWPAMDAPRLTRTDLLMFVPASVLGFALCPYLDLTFHRARQATDPATGRAAFALGFGVLFLAMIVFTLLYAPRLTAWVSPTDTPAAPGSLPPALLWILGVHMTLQAGFTTALHLREVAEHRGHTGLHRLASYAIAAAALAWWALSEPTTTYHGLSIGENVYRFFLLAYGLTFPAYVWLCMIPPRRPVRSGVRLAIFFASVLVALPMAYLGFVALEPVWLLITIAILLLARLAIDCYPAAARRAA